MLAEFGAGISVLWMASAEPSSIKSVRRVKTLWTRKVMMRALMKMKMARPRRISAIVARKGASQGLEVENAVAGVLMEESRND